ncbi:hypothetical protein AYI68_g1398, partial [Smittium mucronatum]
MALNQLCPLKKLLAAAQPLRLSALLHTTHPHKTPVPSHTQVRSLSTEYGLIPSTRQYSVQAPPPYDLEH